MAIRGPSNNWPNIPHTADEDAEAEQEYRAVCFAGLPTESAATSASRRGKRFG